jgi:Ca2+-binding EF-hand superfamily protein
MEGNISLHEYYNALEAYDCRGEDVTPFDDDPMYANFQHMALFKLVKVLRDRSIAHDELFRMIDASGDGIIDIIELKDVLKTFGDFHEKELHTIKKFFDIDNNGDIEEPEFMMQIKKAENQYDAHLNKK